MKKIQGKKKGEKKVKTLATLGSRKGGSATFTWQKRGVKSRDELDRDKTTGTEGGLLFHLVGREKNHKKRRKGKEKRSIPYKKYKKS